MLEDIRPVDALREDKHPRGVSSLMMSEFSSIRKAEIYFPSPMRWLKKWLNFEENILDF